MRTQEKIFDPALVSRARMGEEDALSQLYVQTYPIIFLTVKTLMKDEDEAMDVLQDTYLKAFQKMDQLKEDKAFLSWVKMSAINNTKDRLKKKKPMLFTELSSDTAGEFDEPVNTFKDHRVEYNPEVMMDAKETSRIIREIIDGLPEDQRMAISLFFYQEMSVKQIAEVLSIPEGTVKSRLSLGKKKIEYRVREMEKKGTKLYGFAPIAFFVFLFNNLDAKAAEIKPDMNIFINIKASMEAASATGADTAGALKTEELVDKAKDFLNNTAIPKTKDFAENTAAPMAKKLAKDAAAWWTSASTAVKVAVVIGAVAVVGIGSAVAGSDKKPTRVPEKVVVEEESTRSSEEVEIEERDPNLPERMIETVMIEYLEDLSVTEETDNRDNSEYRALDDYPVKQEMLEAKLEDGKVQFCDVILETFEDIPSVFEKLEASSIDFNYFKDLDTVIDHKRTKLVIKEGSKKLLELDIYTKDGRPDYLRNCFIGMPCSNGDGVAIDHCTYYAGGFKRFNPKEDYDKIVATLYPEGLELKERTYDGETVTYYDTQKRFQIINKFNENNCKGELIEFEIRLQGDNKKVEIAFREFY